MWMTLDGRKSEEKLGVEGRETVIRISCIKKKQTFILYKRKKDDLPHAHSSGGQ